MELTLIVIILLLAKVSVTIQQIIDALNEDPANLRAAKVLATSLKYWQGLEHAAKEWKPSSAT